MPTPIMPATLSAGTMNTTGAIAKRYGKVLNKSEVKLMWPWIVVGFLLAPVAMAADAAGKWDSLGRLAANRGLTVTLRDGRKLKGKLQEFRPDGLTIGNQRLARQDVARVTARSRGLTALIGAAVAGTGVGIPVGTDKKGSPQLTVLAVGVSAGAGAAVGAAIGRTVTLYDAASHP